MNVSISENNNLFHNVVLKYGRENFTLSILKECSIEELNYYERKYINLFHSNDIQFGYNKTSGGDALSVWTEEHRKHHSEIMKEYYKNNPDKRKQSETLKEYCKNHPEYINHVSNSNKEFWKNMSDERRKELSKINSDSKKKYYNEHPESRQFRGEKIKEFYKNLTDEDKMKLNKCKYPKIRCIETNECHWSGEWKKLGYRHVLEVAKGERNHSKNLHFEFVSM